ncbi:metallophosphoesterase [Demequina sp. NBRC 110055]|uniref:metallophosphoesterase family protein n=1 Tax=Demequina sp. NBRC 110055 TaxID=1570344 RepID=UPI000A017F60|nr:metallophosphoesterase [Demequina sp. NBRC 110055]
MILGLLGDVHGNLPWLRHAIGHFQDRGIATIVQVGDLGVGMNPRVSTDWDYIGQFMSDNGMQMLVAPGNHENYDLIASLKPRADGWLPFRDSILLAPRGHRTEHDGRSFVWLGGAASIDRLWRTKHHREWGAPMSWWPGEAITDPDVDTTIAGGRADVMISHEAPYPVESIERRLSPGVFPALDEAYAREVRERFTRAVAAVKPSLLIHGHYHHVVTDVWEDPHTGHTVNIAGLGMDMDILGAAATLDTDTLNVEYLTLTI